jgi:glycosyl transferase family 25
MKIIVISRVSDVRRRDNVCAMLKDSPYEWQFLDAYEVNTIPEWFNAIYDEEKSKKYRSYSLVGGEKGCFSSHVGAWLRCIQLNEPVIVLEDDCTLLPTFFEKIKTIRISSFEYVKLERRSDGYEVDDIFMINKKNRSGTVGYYLSPVGAFKFLSTLNDIYMPIDHYIGMSWKHKVAPIGLINQIITHEGQFGTDIQHDRQKIEKENSKNKWLRFLRKYKRYIDDSKYQKFIDKCRSYYIK